MSAQPKIYYTQEQYVEMERAAAFKSQYISGEIWAMAGGSHEHSLIAANVIREIGYQFKGRPCRVFGSDLRVVSEATGMITYPDVTAVRGEMRFHATDPDGLTNPILLVEVLSPTTELFDRTEKFAHYRRIDSLQEYVLIAQNKVLVEVYARDPDGSWRMRDYTDIDDTVPLESAECRLPLAEIYDKVEFPIAEPHVNG